MRQHHTDANTHERISRLLKNIVGYHQNRIEEIEGGHASVDDDEAKKIKASIKFSAKAHRCANMHLCSMGTALARLSARAAELRLFDPGSPLFKSSIFYSDSE